MLAWHSWGVLTRVWCRSEGVSRAGDCVCPVHRCVPVSQHGLAREQRLQVAEQRNAPCFIEGGNGRRAGAGSGRAGPAATPLPSLLSPCRQSVSGTVHPGLCDRHVRGGCAVVRGRTALPWDAAAQGPDHMGVGSGPARVRPRPLPQPAGSSGAPLGPRLALALPGLPVAGGRHHLPDRSRRGTHGFLTPEST